MIIAVKEEETNTFNFSSFFDFLKKELDHDEIYLRSALDNPSETKLEIFSTSEISNKSVIKSVRKFMAGLGLQENDNGDFCHKEGLGCLEFLKGEEILVIFFTNDTRRSGNIYISCNKY